MKLVEIKDCLKKQFNFKIVCIQSGKFNCFFDEDAILMSEIFDFNIFEKGERKVTGFPIWIPKRKYIEYFNENNLTFAFLTQHKEVKDKDTQVLKRIITNSSNLDTLGIEFFNESRIKSNEKEDIEENNLELRFLEAVLKGYNPITGEVLEKDSVWKHPQITSDVAEYLSDFRISENISKDKENDLKGEDLYLLKKLITHIQKLNPRINVRDFEIIKYRYGIDGSGKRTLREVGEKFSISHERVRQIINRSIDQLKFANDLDNKKPNKAIYNKIPYKDSINYIIDILNKIIDANITVISEDVTQYSYNSSDNAYYQLEKVGSFSPINLQLEESSKLLWQDAIYIQKLREENRMSGRLLNRGFPITHEEINLILEYSKQGWSVSKLETYFQRSYKSILHIIELNSN